MTWIELFDYVERIKNRMDNNTSLLISSPHGSVTIKSYDTTITVHIYEPEYYISSYSVVFNNRVILIKNTIENYKKSIHHYHRYKDEIEATLILGRIIDLSLMKKILGESNELV